MKIAVIGAGISGITAARQLTRWGHKVQIFEKSRGLGGRMATRRTEYGSFDHGAQYFTAQNPDFQAGLQDWLKAGVAKIWDVPVSQWQGHEFSPLSGHTKRFIGIPTMNAPVKLLAEGLDVRKETLIVAVKPSPAGWLLMSETSSYSGFDALIISAPAEQTRALVGDLSPEIADAIKELTMKPVWALILSFKDKIPLPFDACFMNQGPFSWLARNSSKPARLSPWDNWLIHASSHWSEQHLEGEQDEIKKQLLNEFEKLAGHGIKPQFVDAHRWRYSIPSQALSERFLWDGEMRLGVCGDWCGGPKVEGAFLSGLALSQKIMSSL